MHRTAVVPALAGLLLVACAGSPSAAPTAGPTALIAGPITIQAPGSVGAGDKVVVTWTGVPGRGDYLIIVPKGATRTNNEPFVDVAAGDMEVTLTAPASAGDYEIWFVEGDTVDKVKARLPLTVT